MRALNVMMSGSLWDGEGNFWDWMREQLSSRFFKATNDIVGAGIPATVRAWADEQGAVEIIIGSAAHFVNNARQMWAEWELGKYPATDEYVVQGAERLVGLFNLVDGVAGAGRRLAENYDRTANDKKLADVAADLDRYLQENPLSEATQREGGYEGMVRRWKGETAPPTAGDDPVPDASAADGAKGGLIIGPTVGAGGELDPTVGEADGQSKGFAAGDPVPMTSPLIFPADPVRIADVEELPGYTIDPTLDADGLLVFPITADADASIVLSAAAARPAVRIEYPEDPVPVSTPRPAGGWAGSEADPEEAELTPARRIPEGRWRTDPNLWPMMVAEPQIVAFNPMAAVSAGERFMHAARAVFDARYPLGSPARFGVERAVLGRLVAAAGDGGVLYRVGAGADGLTGGYRVVNARPASTVAQRVPGGSGQRPTAGGTAGAAVLRGLGWAGALLGAPTFMEAVRQDMILQRLRDGKPILDTSRTVDGVPIIIYPQY